MKFKAVHNKRVLISPLNWGMGHVSRCIGLIHRLHNQGNTVVVAADETQITIFKTYFPDVETVIHQGYPFSFSGSKSFGLDLIRSSKGLKSRLNRELEQTEHLVDKYNIDVVVSDHRYGFRSQKVKSIFVTHQLNLPIKWYEVCVQLIHKAQIKKFDQVWVMDYPDHRLAGHLSKTNANYPVDYLGAVSRFEIYGSSEIKKKGGLVIVSGPYVYAQQFIDGLDVKVSGNSLMKVVAPKEVNVPLRFERIEGDWRNLDKEILKAKSVISRSGYSTIMDLQFLKCNATLSATPGQREQEYLEMLHESSNSSASKPS
ncbi:MAG: hypothetical protein MK105_11655 [Crocinitomicaceae bacterium]|nr:hypothetical protein [Crocinitomicaceae bacterium]